MGAQRWSTAVWGVFFLLAAVVFRVLRVFLHPRSDGAFAFQTLTALLVLLGVGMIVSAVAARVGREKT